LFVLDNAHAVLPLIKAGPFLALPYQRASGKNDGPIAEIQMTIFIRNGQQFGHEDFGQNPAFTQVLAGKRLKTRDSSNLRCNKNSGTPRR
jgi:hypothetical protein